MKILTVVLTFSSLYLSHALQISSNPIYEIVANTDSKKCYTCEDNCSSVTLTNCDKTSKCFSKTTRNGKTKGCVNSNVDICGATDKETSCYTCDGDFCNIETHEEVDYGVNRCYVCEDECPIPAVQHDCREVLEAIEGKPVPAACITFKIKKENETTVMKGCVFNTDVARQTCTMSNLFYPEVSCSICQTDRCNAEAEDTEDYAEKCYHCTDSCETPVVQNCQELLGEGTKSKCIAAEKTENGKKNHWRTCVEITTTVLENCAAYKEIGENCTICDSDLCNVRVVDDEGSPGAGETLLASFAILFVTYLVQKL